MVGICIVSVDRKNDRGRVRREVNLKYSWMCKNEGEVVNAQNLIPSNHIGDTVETGVMSPIAKRMFLLLR